MHIHLSNANCRFLRSCAIHRRKFTLFLILLLTIRYASLPISSACRKAALPWISPMSVTPPQKSVFAVLSKNTPPILPDLSMRHLRREHPHRLLSQGDRSLETSNRQETMDWLDPAWFSSGRSSRSNRLVLQKQSHLLSTFSWQSRLRHRA